MTLSHRDTDSLNEIFYSTIKPSARPIEGFNYSYRLADCRLMTFKSVSEATRL